MNATTTPPDVSILVPDVSSPSIGAAIRLRALMGGLNVEIVGPDLGAGICSLYQSHKDIRAIQLPRIYRYPDFLWQSRALARAATGRLVIGLKAYMNTVPVALRLQREGRAVAGVFLDEWDGAVLDHLSPAARTIRFLKHMHHPLEDVYYARVERMIPRCRVILSTTTFLQRRFGGDVLYMGVNTDRFCPQPEAQVAALRQELGLAGKKVVVFGGVVRPHKGIQQLLDVLLLLRRDDLRLLVVGPVTEHLAALMADDRYKALIQVAGAPERDPAGVNARIHQSMPLYLDLADAILLPQENNLLAQSQMPIKLFEAMAMAKPIVASAISDLPEILQGCGWTVPSGDVPALAEGLRRILQQPAEARATGQAARRKCLDLYSEAVSRQHLLGIVRRATGEKPQGDGSTIRQGVHR